MRRVLLFVFVLLLGLPGLAFAETDLPPVPVLNVRSDNRIQDPKTGTTQSEFTFDANGSRDDKTSSSKLEVRFDFDNDGRPDTYFSQRKIEKYVFKTPGVKTVRMEVLDGAGNISETSVTVMVVKNTPPFAFFTVSPSSGTPAAVFSFDVSGSSDSQYKSSSLVYRFDWNSDGVWDTHYEGKTRFEHKFLSAGTYDVTMEVRDPEGLIAQSRVTITVSGNQPPMASFTVKQEKLGATYTFDASASTDPETPKKLKYRWDLDYTGPSDIHFDTNFILAPRYTAKFVRPGKRTIRLQVQDADGATSEAFQGLDISPSATLVNILQSVGIDIEALLAPYASNAPLTRGEMARLIITVKGISVASVPKEQQFPDVSPSDPLAPYIFKAVDLKYMKVFVDGKFRPEAPVTRAEGLALIFRVYNIPIEKTLTPPPFTDVKANYWFYDIVATAYKRGLIKGTSANTFEPGRTITRGEAVTIIRRLLQP